MFEKRNPEKEDYYLSDNDWTISSIVKKIRSSQQFQLLPRTKQRSKELSAASMKEFFKTNGFYKHDVYTNSSTKQTFLKDYRLKVDEDR